MKVYKYLINKILFGAAVIVFIAACEEEDSGELINTQLTGSTKVFFDPDNSSSVAETANVLSSPDGSSSVTGDNTVDVGVVRTGTDFSAEVTVSFTATTVYANTTDFFDAGDDASSTVTFSREGSITIPAGETRGSVVVAIGDDATATGDRTITLTLTESSAGELGFSASDAKTTQTITIVDDDCPIDLATFAGNYTLASFGTDDSCCPGFDLCAAASRDCSGFLTLAADPSDPTGTSAILNHSSFGSPYGIKFVTCPQQVEVITPLTSWFGIGWQMQQGPTLGTYNDENKSITIIGQLGGNGEFTMELTKVE